MSDQSTEVDLPDGPEAPEGPAAPGTGVRLVEAHDPAARAGELATELDGDLVADLRSAEQAVRDRIAAGRRMLAAGDDDDALLAQAEAIRAAAAEPPPITPEQVDEIRRLAAQLATATRIRTRTEARAADDLRDRVHASAGLTVHPSAIRAAADAVAEAAREVAEAELALGQLGEDLVLAELTDSETHE